MVMIEEVSVEGARAILERGFISAVGHEATAKFLSKILGLEVRPSREAVFLHEGDAAIAIQFGRGYRGSSWGKMRPRGPSGREGCRHS
jgi:hypothetical protein